jgi:cytoskeletal protein CcmA (bactofilin family)
MKLFGRRPTEVGDRGYSLIDNALTISGDINTTGTVRIDGRVEGTLHRADTLIIGKDGVIVGNVEAREVVVGGQLAGNLIARERVEIQATAAVRGDIRAAAVQLMEGGSVHGHISIASIGEDAAQKPIERKLTLTPSASSRAIGQG